MRLDNRTKYPTRLLRAIICRAHNDVAKTEGRLPQWRGVKFTIRRRIEKPTVFDGKEYIGSWVSGHASLGGYRSTMTMPCPKATSAGLYSTAWHELYHLYGYQHGQMGKKMTPTDEETAAALVGLPRYLEEVAPKKVSRADRVAARRSERMGTAEAKVIEWTRKVKTANTKLRKWRRAAARYRQAIAAMPPQPEESE